MSCRRLTTHAFTTRVARFRPHGFTFTTRVARFPSTQIARTTASTQSPPHLLASRKPNPSAFHRNRTNRLSPLRDANPPLREIDGRRDAPPSRRKVHSRDASPPLREVDDRDARPSSPRGQRPCSAAGSTASSTPPPSSATSTSPPSTGYSPTSGGSRHIAVGKPR